MRKFLRVLGAVAIVTISFYVTPFVMDFAPRCPQAEAIEPPFANLGAGDVSLRLA
jgi:hypothetical protein